MTDRCYVTIRKEPERRRPWVSDCWAHTWSWESSTWALAMEATDDHLHDHHRDEDD